MHPGTREFDQRSTLSRRIARPFRASPTSDPRREGASSAAFLPRLPRSSLPHCAMSHSTGRGASVSPQPEPSPQPSRALPPHQPPPAPRPAPPSRSPRPPRPARPAQTAQTAPSGRSAPAAATTGRSGEKSAPLGERTEPSGAERPESSPTERHEQHEQHEQHERPGRLRAADRDLVVALSPFEEPNPRIVTAAERAGALGLLDLGRDAGAARSAMAEIARRLGAGRYGVRVPAGCTVGPEELPAEVDTVLLADPAGHTPEGWPAGRPPTGGLGCGRRSPIRPKPRPRWPPG